MFQRATKKMQKARIAMFGPAGSGKTYTALLVARGLVGPQGRIAVIDTERGSASKYSDLDAFDVAELRSFAPEKYIAALRAAAGAGYPAVVIDSLSHAWEGEAGILDQVDKRGGRFDAWKEMTPQLRDLVNMMLDYPGHIIVTMRSKTEYVVEKNERGKSEPRKIGLAPRFKDGMEYEFDIVCELDDSNTMKVTKSRCAPLSGRSITKPGAEFARTVLEWLNAGEAVAEPAREVPQEAPKRKAVSVDEIADESDLREYGARYRSGLSALANGRRKNAQTAVMAAAERCGVDPNVALAWCGLVDEVAA